MYRILLMALMLILVSGCMANKNQSSDKNHYAEDGYMGLTNTNPSLVATPHSNNMAGDLKAMKRALHEISEIRRSRIILDGGKAYIHLHLKRGLTEEQSSMVRTRAEQRLSEMIPQYYRIRVTVDE